MMLEWQPAYLEPVVVVLLFALCYTLYHYDLLEPLFSRLLNPPGREETGIALHLYRRRMCGVILLGVVPLIVVTLLFRRHLSEYGVRAVRSLPVLFAALGVCGLLFPILRSHARRAAGFTHRAPTSPPARLFNGLSWTAYLVAYEFFLRGVLLFTLARYMGGWPAIAVVTAVYTAIHLPKERGETFGSFVMGLVLGTLTLLSGSIVPALIVHVFTALVTDYMVDLFQRRVRPGR
jgi:membrane protease YdiL (CAAX protease family)